MFFSKGSGYCQIFKRHTFSKSFPKLKLIIPFAVAGSAAPGSLSKRQKHEATKYEYNGELT